MRSSPHGEARVLLPRKKQQGAGKPSKQKHMHSLPTNAYTQNKYLIRWGRRARGTYRIIAASAGGLPLAEWEQNCFSIK